ncbi:MULTISPECIES: sigma-like protein [unclassified Streptomyces]|uniref:sigma-like protein n=1 Tax=unclassified Streptomyces TaxID=2593676 RepID=UPI0036CF4804
MSDIKQSAEEITTLDSHAPAPPSKDAELTTQDSHAPVPGEDTVTTLDSHAPAPPALDLNGK